MLYIAYAVLWLLRFALGACVFSFLGVVVWRLPRRESVVKGRSHCPVCGRTLSAAELLPCLSYLLQGGKCRGCGAKIPARDFWIEVLGGFAPVPAHTPSAARPHRRRWRSPCSVF
ncbi:MAG: prepilin peptidase [Butyricicoccus sp.]